MVSHILPAQMTPHITSEHGIKTKMESLKCIMFNFNSILKSRLYQKKRARNHESFVKINSDT